ncbi:DUF308 domain-containing protein [Sphingobium sp. H39-3-25]|jgi:uncharacterized membrane protein HdeD (DUF308 family)|uniref:HdeD family acid-resistance protein n=1 Tax=Sphingomonadales TaxID=204457 RepID=UPI00082C9AE7|nr:MULTISPECIES: DUF308 domain-containing protein [Sphingomonadaceae]MDF0488877.1 DUF308 domain-containing protein [Sphingomonas pollutisoli]MDF0546084.1 DUF308 domain-containing protein [Sphingobium arseniciresistens]
MTKKRINHVTRHLLRSEQAWMLAYGIAVAILGMLGLLHPFLFGLSAGTALGFGLLGYGVLMVVAGLSRRRKDRSEALFGALTLIGGGIVLFHPLAGGLSLVWLSSAWLLVGARFTFSASLRKREDRPWLICLSIVNVVLGLSLLFVHPIVAITYVGIAIGLSLLVRSLFLIWLALRLRQRRYF